MKNGFDNFNRMWPPSHLMVLRKSWDMRKSFIFYRSKEEEYVYHWLDGRKITISDLTNNPLDNITDLYTLTSVTSNLNPLLNIQVPFNIILPETLSGTCMDQYGNLFTFRHTDTNYKDYTIEHIACGFQSPLFKYDGETFLEENILRRIPPTIINNKEYVFLKELPKIQQTQIAKEMSRQIVNDKILFVDYGSWHYYWYEENKWEYWQKLSDIR